MLLMLASANPEEHVLPHRFFKLVSGNLNFGIERIPILNIDFGPRNFYFTNHLLMVLVAAALCLLLFPTLARRYARSQLEPSAPRGWSNFFEAMMQFIRQDVARPVLGHRTDAYIPFLWSLFFFILFCNLLGMIPLDSIIYLVSGRTIQHVGGTATGNLAVTGGLALCALFAIHGCGVREVYRQLVSGTYGHHEHHNEHDDASHAHAHEPGEHHGALAHHGPASRGWSPGAAALAAAPLYLWNFAPHVLKPGPQAGPVSRLLTNVADVLMWALLLILEFIGAIVKPFALMVRLFANMIAGHIVLASIMGIIFVSGSYFVGGAVALGCAALNLLELFVAFLQAYIFTFLTTLFIGAAVAPEH